MILALILQAAACPATPAALPPELAGWSTHRRVTAAADPPVVAIGEGARATLLPASKVRLAVPATKPQAAEASAGLFTFFVPAPGRYRVALGTGAWIDVVRDGQIVSSVAHGHGPACSPVRKMVDFQLRPGHYLLQIVGSPVPAVDLLIARLG